MNTPTNNMLFFSKKCPTCTNLLKILENEKLIGYFILICVDDKLNKLPPQIEMVPTMIVKDCGKPLVAEETFEWIKKVKFINQRSQLSHNKLINVPTNVVKDNVKGYSDVEMGSKSDTFAYTLDNMPALPQSYFGCNDEDKYAIFTAHEQDPLTENDQKKLITQLEHKRRDQDKQNIEVAKKQQISAIIGVEQQKIVDEYKLMLQKNRQNYMDQMRKK